VSFHPHFWEMYLAAALMRAARLVPRCEWTIRGRGPDLQMAQPKTWIEAVAPGPGTGPDAVTDGPPGVARDVPDDAIKLRLLTAISEKVEKVEKYVRDGTINAFEPCVIAVNTGLAERTRGDLDVPRIVRCLLPFGHEVIEIDRNDGRVVGRWHDYRPAVAKLSGATVATTGFETPAWPRIGAVVHSSVDAFNGPQVIGSDFVIVHNPRAENPLPHGVLRLGTEYWVEKQSIRGHRWWMSESM